MAAAAKKRRPEEEEAAGAEEEMHLAFRGAANALSQVYGQAVAAQEKSFRAGERRAMENVYRWICSKHQEGLEVSVADLVAFLQTEIEHRAGEVPGSLQHTSAQPACQFPSANIQSNSFSFGNRMALSTPYQMELELKATILPNIRISCTATRNWPASHPFLLADPTAAACSDSHGVALSASEWAAELLRRRGEEGERQPGGAAAVGFPLYASLHIGLPVDDACCQALVGWALDAIPVFPLDELTGVYLSAVQDVAKDGHAECTDMRAGVRKTADGG
ncbi:Os01g0182500 [Oryza sativa Japonica Group]|uniref:Os01g0182500 protein n=1 Tax=Oryza sativa subsp. japonica TaxID=39947 RepID=C7IW81_ORYSJ|nr:Os01g0182500 [Oryza sativa Japonica Group]|eukprot:NP_001172208.1 Os01g0182500 [Oryza sativa Japonica Group]